jgi:hypothetical protein
MWSNKSLRFALITFALIESKPDTERLGFEIVGHKNVHNLFDIIKLSALASASSSTCSQKRKQPKEYKNLSLKHRNGEEKKKGSEEWED